MTTSQRPLTRPTEDLAICHPKPIRPPIPYPAVTDAFSHKPVGAESPSFTKRRSAPQFNVSMERKALLHAEFSVPLKGPAQVTRAPKMPSKIQSRNNHSRALSPGGTAPRPASHRRTPCTPNAPQMKAVLGRGDEFPLQTPSAQHGIDYGSSSWSDARTFTAFKPHEQRVEVNQTDTGEGIDFAYYKAFHEKDRAANDKAASVISPKQKFERLSQFGNQNEIERISKKSSVGLQITDGDKLGGLPKLSNWPGYDSWAQEIESSIRAHGEDIVMDKAMASCFVEGTRPWEWLTSLNSELVYSMKSRRGGWKAMQALIQAEISTQDLLPVKALGRTKLPTETCLEYAVCKLQLLENSFPALSEHQKVTQIMNGISSEPVYYYCNEETDIFRLCVRLAEFDIFSSSIGSQNITQTADILASAGFGRRNLDKLQKFCEAAGLYTSDVRNTR